jgi:hypothetical protein
VYFDGTGPGSISDVIPGAHIDALGTVDPNQTTLDALVVVVWNKIATPQPQIPVSQLNNNGLGHHRGGFAHGGGQGGGQGWGH